MENLGISGLVRPFQSGQQELFYLRAVKDITELILGLHPANERRRYKVTPSLIGWAQT